jgi:hypothetical protein
VHFNIPSDEPVYVGRYGKQKKAGTARKIIPVLLQKPFGTCASSAFAASEPLDFSPFRPASPGRTGGRIEIA